MKGFIKGANVPFINDRPTFEAVAELKRVAEGQRDSIGSGVKTPMVELVPGGGTQVIQHGLGRMPQGWWVHSFYGYVPWFSVTAVDDKRIHITSHLPMGADTRFCFWVY
jgi:hypothetical protein